MRVFNQHINWAPWLSTTAQLYQQTNFWPTIFTIFLSNSRKRVMTIETTYSQAREQLKSLMDRAVDDREVILVRRRTGGDVAMIAADELESLVETAHLLRSEKIAPTTMAHLNKLVGDDT